MSLGCLFSHFEINQMLTSKGFTLYPIRSLESVKLLDSLIWIMLVLRLIGNSPPDTIHLWWKSCNLADQETNSCSVIQCRGWISCNGLYYVWAYMGCNLLWDFAWLIMVLYHCIVITKMPSILLRILLATKGPSIVVEYDFVREAIMSSHISIPYIKTEGQIANIFIEPLHKW